MDLNIDRSQASDTGKQTGVAKQQQGSPPTGETALSVTLSSPASSCPSGMKALGCHLLQVLKEGLEIQIFKI